MQRALLQWKKPENRHLVLRALRETGREDLIGYGRHCLIRPDAPARTGKAQRKSAKTEPRAAKSAPKGRGGGIRRDKKESPRKGRKK